MKIKQNIFKWHRILGIITLIPVLFWSLSGIMHPFMAHWFKPDIANTYYTPAIIDTVDLKSLKQTLEVNGIKQFTNVRIVKYDKQQYFQLEDQPNHFRYLNCSSGKELHNGDKKYATHLARYFLQDSTSKIASIQKITAFSQEYKYINRLLPVWKVSFARKDKMDVYLETQHNRLGTYNTSSRKIFIALFNTFHNWSFLDKIANNEIRIFVMLILLTVISLSALSGLIIYGLFWNKLKNRNDSSENSRARRRHRRLGIAVSIVTLTFAFSGGFHATRKLNALNLPNFQYQSKFETSKMSAVSLNKLLVQATAFSMVEMDNKIIFRTENSTSDTQVVNYFDAQELSKIENGDEAYAQYLCNFFSEKYNFNLANPMKEPRILNEFEKKEYGFVFKRLPVFEFCYVNKSRTNLYIETSSSRLAAKIENIDRNEGLSFAIFHKFLFLDWAGKNARDITMLITALGIFMVSIFGLKLLILSKK